MITWLPAMQPNLEQLCAAWSIPLGVPVGWIQVESGGNPHSTTPLDELGYFQIFPEESKDLGFDHAKIGADAQYGVACGFRLMDHYRRFARNLLNSVGAGAVPDDSELLWRFAKFCHSIGAGAARKCCTAASLECLNWDRFASFCTANMHDLRASTKHDPVKWIGLVDRMFEIGAPFGFKLTCQAPVIPNS